MINQVLANNIPWHIQTGDALETLRLLPDECIHCVVTSPPYWGLRDYGVTGQIGLEKSLDEYLEKLTNVFREVRRVLRIDGVCWLNMGDKYANTGYSGGGDPTVWMRNLGGQKKIKRQVPMGLKPKDLIGVPWRLVFALQADGWWLRRDVIWAKRNPMPESVTDRPTSAHEYIFLLTKSDRYFYDSEAVKEPSIEANWESRFDRIKSDHKSTPDAMKNGMRAKRCGKNSRFDVDRDPEHGMRKQDAIGKGTYAGFNDRYTPSGKRNLRSVWNMATHPYSETHFATFPPRLPEICIRAGTSQHGACARCGAPWRRNIERINTGLIQKSPDGWDTGEGAHGSVHRNGRESGKRGIPVYKTETIGWKPTCKCDCSEVVPCIVLDPFAGAGTTLMVALRLGRRALGIELNPDYVRLAEERILEDSPLLNYRNPVAI